MVSNEPFIIAYAGFDGFLRVVDINNLLPILSFKSNYGGINNLSIEKDPKSSLIALACQDDSTVVLNLETRTYLRISGHLSFISKAIF